MYLICMNVHLIYICINISSLQEILNHVLADIEFFIGKVGAALAQEDEKKRKKKKKGKSTIIYGKLQQFRLRISHFSSIFHLIFIYTHTHTHMCIYCVHTVHMCI